jgi:hypothetical protein
MKAPSEPGPQSTGGVEDTQKWEESLPAAAVGRMYVVSRRREMTVAGGSHECYRQRTTWSAIHAETGQIWKYKNSAGYSVFSIRVTCISHQHCQRGPTMTDDA